ncbi:GNAT family N-acetyltransferase [Streptomyces sp. NPDC014894]|uniref:GNAT family N-acetyltransferase n=1 Tax=Streptomyces sp. NPDC014894 TaxID=3364931 RepID=UPI003703636F
MSRTGGASRVRRAVGPAPAGAPRFTVRPLDPLADAELVHGWVTHPKAVYWMMQDARLQDIEREYMAKAAHDHQDAFIGLADGKPSFLMESYDPRHVELGALYPPEPGDVGLHFLVAPTDAPVHGFTRAAIASAMRELFADPATRRVVVEPDVRNDAARRIFEYAGFTVVSKIEKPEKDAYLCVCPRERFERSAAGRPAAH